MSRVVPGGRTPSRKLASSMARQPKPRRRYNDEENMSKVHQDEDYGKEIFKMFHFSISSSDEPLRYGWYNVCTAEPILDNCFTELVLCGLSCFPFGCIIF